MVSCGMTKALSRAETFLCARKTDFGTSSWVKVRLTPRPSPKAEGSRKEQIGYVFGGFLDSLERNDL